MHFPDPLESGQYKDPMEVYAAKQAREQRQKKRIEVDQSQRWSPARRELEALFEQPK